MIGRIFSTALKYGKKGYRGIKNYGGSAVKQVGSGVLWGGGMVGVDHAYNKYIIKPKNQQSGVEHKNNYSNGAADDLAKTTKYAAGGYLLTTFADVFGKAYNGIKQEAGGLLVLGALGIGGYVLYKAVTKKRH